MKKKLKKILIPFVLILIFNILGLNLSINTYLGIFAPHVGMLYVCGLLFGPYGAFGAVLANIILDFIGGYTPIEILPSAIFSFGVSYLGYKLWYTFGDEKHEINTPILDNAYHLALFLGSIVICGITYTLLHAAIAYVFFDSADYTQLVFTEYFLNFINIAFIFGIINIWLFNKIKFTHIPKKSKRTVNHRLYKILFILFLLSLVLLTIPVYLQSQIGTIIGIVLVGIILFAYLTKPLQSDAIPVKYTSVTKKVTTAFLIATILIAISGIIISFLLAITGAMMEISFLGETLKMMQLLLITDGIIMLFFIPGFFIIKYIESKVIAPISSFSQIESFINENQKIEAEKLLDVYSAYINENDEIGMLARSYSDLIKHNNNYIENIHEIESEKEHIKAELDIATKIQESRLPTEAIECEDYTVDGYSHPAKEVGGDFFDYYILDDDNLAIVIGDASGKGVPAALLATITQVMVEQLLEYDSNPSTVLTSLNNRLCKNNSESMFITLWLGIYNKTTNKLTFSNAGHNPPLIKENGEFKYLEVDNGIVLGIMEDYEYVKEEITLSDELIVYTDGITDATNKEDEMYGENRLLNFFNEFKIDNNPMHPLLEDITEFTNGNEQFDDMTLLYLKIKKISEI